LLFKINKLREKIKKRLEWFLKSPKEYAFCIRELEDILGLPHTKIISWIDEGFWPHGKGVFLRPIIWPFWRETPLQVAIHEVRHFLQLKCKIRLLSLNEIKNLSLKIEIEKLVNELKGKEDICYLEYEIDARIIEVLGYKLLKDGRVEEFRDLMLNNIIPTSFLFLKLYFPPMIGSDWSVR
jgi:hypothetical protein